MTRLFIYIFVALAWASSSVAQITGPFIGLWSFETKSGFKGSLSFDGKGGCFYFATTAFVAIQATCVPRLMNTGQLMVFGTQEGTFASTPTYDILTPSGQAQTFRPVALHFVLGEPVNGVMQGYLVSAAGHDSTTFTLQSNK